MTVKIKPCVVCKSDMEYVRVSKKTCSAACRMALVAINSGSTRVPKRALPKGTYWCPMCESVKNLSECYIKPDGKPFTYCKPCKRKDARARLRRAKGLPDDAVISPDHSSLPIGTTRTDSHGYTMQKVGLTQDVHIRADKHGWVFQHILVAEEKYGISITRHYTVHHKNGNRSDNRPENLEIRHGNHGKGADILPFLLQDSEGRETAISILEEYGYTVQYPV